MSEPKEKPKLKNRTIDEMFKKIRESESPENQRNRNKKCKRGQTDSQEPDHERHHEFISSPTDVYERERRTVAFGADIYQIQTVRDITLYLTEIEYTSRNYKNPYTCMPVRKFRDIQDTSDLGQLF
ncbi:Hypothetical predicted protein, partial [Mytilus galloprovincialis]